MASKTQTLGLDLALEAPPARLQPLTLSEEQCTAYVLGGFGYRMHELREIEVKIGRYAQHPAAVRFEWVEKGKRKRWEGVETSSPSLIVVKGHGHPGPNDPMTPKRVEGHGAAQVTSSMTRWTCYAPEWAEEFERTHGAYLATKQVHADYRGFDVSGGARFIQLSQGAELTAGDRVMTRHGRGLIVKVARKSDNSLEAFYVRMDQPLPNTVVTARGHEARLWWEPAADCRWEGAANASEVAP